MELSSFPEQLPPPPKEKPPIKSPDKPTQSIHGSTASPPESAKVTEMGVGKELATGRSTTSDHSFPASRDMRPGIKAEAAKTEEVAETVESVLPKSPKISKDAIEIPPDQRQDTPDNGNCFFFSSLCSLVDIVPPGHGPVDDIRDVVNQAQIKYNEKLQTGNSRIIDAAKQEFDQSIGLLATHLREEATKELEKPPNYPPGAKPKILNEGIIRYNDSIAAEEKSLTVILEILKEPMSRLQEMEATLANIETGGDPSIQDVMLSSFISALNNEIEEQYVSQESNKKPLPENATLEEVRARFNELKGDRETLIAQKESELANIQTQYIKQTNITIGEGFIAQELADSTIESYFAKTAEDTGLLSTDSIKKAVEDEKLPQFSDEEKEIFLFEGIVPHNEYIQEQIDSLNEMLRVPDLTAEQKTQAEERLATYKNMLIKKEGKPLGLDDIAKLDEAAIHDYLEKTRDPSTQVSFPHIRALSDVLRRPIIVWMPEDQAHNLFKPHVFNERKYRDAPPIEVVKVGGNHYQKRILPK